MSDRGGRLRMGGQKAMLILTHIILALALLVALPALGSFSDRSTNQGILTNLALLASWLLLGAVILAGVGLGCLDAIPGPTVVRLFGWLGLHAMMLVITYHLLDGPYKRLSEPALVCIYFAWLLVVAAQINPALHALVPTRVFWLPLLGFVAYFAWGSGVVIAYERARDRQLAQERQLEDARWAYPEGSLEELITMYGQRNQRPAVEVIARIGATPDLDHLLNDLLQRENPLNYYAAEYIREHHPHPSAELAPGYSVYLDHLLEVAKDGYSQYPETWLSGAEKIVRAGGDLRKPLLAWRAAFEPFAQGKQWVDRINEVLGSHKTARTAAR